MHLLCVTLFSLLAIADHKVYRACRVLNILLYLKSPALIIQCIQTLSQPPLPNFPTLLITFSFLSCHFSSASTMRLQQKSQDHRNSPLIRTSMCAITKIWLCPRSLSSLEGLLHQLWTHLDFLFSQEAEAHSTGANVFRCLSSPRATRLCLDHPILRGDPRIFNFFPFHQADDWVVFLSWSQLSTL